MVPLVNCTDQPEVYRAETRIHPALKPVPVLVLEEAKDAQNVQKVLVQEVEVSGIENSPFHKSDILVIQGVKVCLHQPVEFMKANYKANCEEGLSQKMNLGIQKMLLMKMNWKSWVRNYF